MGKEGGTVVIGLRKEIPEQFWNQVEILLVGGNSGAVGAKVTRLTRFVAGWASHILIA